MKKAIQEINEYIHDGQFLSIPCLFENEAQYEEFVARHAKAKAKRGDIETYSGKAFLGIDAGSTTVKAVLIGTEGQLLHSIYRSNSGNPVPAMKEYLTEIYEKYPNIQIASSAVTGYGEELLKNAFRLDFGIVETIAHYTAAKYFLPEVDFIIDIGGQDMKCFKIHNGAIDNIFLNEACSSGCGSFLQTFANTLGYEIPEFAKMGLFAKHPVDLGSRCTVFMNSSVKQAQKDGATTEDISAGLSVSVVKNAIYKVIRAASADELGKNIVVQGGTFLNDAVLRVFEQELKVNVIRPDISGLMGAFGAAMYAMQREEQHPEFQTHLISLEELQHFTHDVKVATCGLCNNHCRLTINSFGSERKFIGGNRCDKPLSKKKQEPIPNMYDFKLETLLSYQPVAGKQGQAGVANGLKYV